MLVKCFAASGFNLRHLVLCPTHKSDNGRSFLRWGSDEKYIPSLLLGSRIPKNHPMKRAVTKTKSQLRMAMARKRTSIGRTAAQGGAVVVMSRENLAIKRKSSAARVVPTARKPDRCVDMVNFATTEFCPATDGSSCRTVHADTDCCSAAPSQASPTAVSRSASEAGGISCESCIDRLNLLLLHRTEPPTRTPAHARVRTRACTIHYLI